MLRNQRPWDKGLQSLLLLICAFNVVPNFTFVPLWASLTAIAALLWKAAYLHYGYALPKRWLLGVGACAVAGTTFLEFGTIIGQEAASSFLIVLAAMKLLETNRYRDAMFVILTSYFLLMVHLLESQTLVSTIYMGLDVLLITTLMFHVHKRDRRGSVRSFRPIMRMLALALPVWILFFVAFPRFSTAFLNIGAPAKSGFSDSLDPGTIESLAKSEETAFRVSFTRGAVPLPETLYFRGGVLSQSHGLRWTKGTPSATALARPAEQQDGPEISYEVWLESGFARWLFALESATSLRLDPKVSWLGLRRLKNGVYEVARDVQSRILYRASAIRTPSVDVMTPTDRANELQLPDDLDPRVRELAVTLKAEVDAAPRSDLSREEQYADRVLRWLQKEKFVYTLEPGALAASTAGGQLSQFLFETKRGFCEHYAASFSTVMRLMDVPARVVLGFQGGRVNDIGSYLIVRHMDAHAWTEIFRAAGPNGEGRWIRIDPTSMIAPLRLQLGGDYNRLDPGQLAGGFSEEEIRRRVQSALGGPLARLALAWDATQMRWNAFLLEYDFEYQMDLLRSLGITDATRWWLAAGLGISLFASGALIFLFLRRRDRRPEPVLQIWREFSALWPATGAAGLAPRFANEGPLAFVERLRPHLSAEQAPLAENFANTFVELRYGPRPTPARERELLASLRNTLRDLRRRSRN